MCVCYMSARSTPLAVVVIAVCAFHGRWATNAAKYYAHFAECRSRGMSFGEAKVALRDAWAAKGTLASEAGTRTLWFESFVAWWHVQFKCVTGLL